MTPDIQTILGEVDHTVLAPTSTAAKFAECCDFAAAHHCASVCICPFYVKEAAARLEGTGVAVCTVIGFPHGTHATAAKVAETRIAIEDGADELDMVVNVSKVKDGDWDYVKADVAAVLDAVRAAGKLLKVIFECCFLTDAEKIRLCEICTELGVDFVKTSTGFGTGGATLEDVQLMRAAIGPEMGLKAAGGIRTCADALAMLRAGATRLGTSAGRAIVEGFDG